MRPRKDPRIRREMFIEAATGLFLQYGNEKVSIKAVLEAVGDRSASPSVFYYYFKNKDELYRAVIRHIADTYVSGFEKTFADNGTSLEEKAAALARMMVSSIAANRSISYEGLSAADRGFVLDMKEQVTASLAEMWERFLSGYGLCKDEDVKQISLFIAGGIAQMIMDYLSRSGRSEESERKLVRNMVLFSASVIGFDEGKSNS